MNTVTQFPATPRNLLTCHWLWTHMRRALLFPSSSPRLAHLCRLSLSFPRAPNVRTLTPRDGARYLESRTHKEVVRNAPEKVAGKEDVRRGAREARQASLRGRHDASLRHHSPVPQRGVACGEASRRELLALDVKYVLCSVGRRSTRYVCTRSSAPKMSGR